MPLELSFCNISGNVIGIYSATDSCEMPKTHLDNNSERSTTTPRPDGCPGL